MEEEISICDWQFRYNCEDCFLKAKAETEAKAKAKAKEALI